MSDDQSYTQREYLIPANELYDEGGELKFIRPAGWDVPLRLHRDEWFNDGWWDDPYPFPTITFHQRFTMWVEYRFVAGTAEKRWGRQFEIACPRGTPSHVVFGPYKERGRAEREALEYLVKAGAVEIIDEK